MKPSLQTKSIILGLLFILLSTFIFAINDSLQNESINQSNISETIFINTTNLSINITNSINISENLSLSNLSNITIYDNLSLNLSLELNSTFNESNISDSILNDTITISLSTEVSPYKDKKPKLLKFNTGEYLPSKGINETLKLKTKNLKKDETIYAIIQFNRNPSKDELKELEKEGIELSDYISSYSWYARISTDLDTIFENNIDGDILLKNKKFKDKFVVRSIDSIKPEYKLSSHLRNNQIGDWTKDDNGNIYLIVQFHNGVTLDEAEKLMKTNGIEVVSRLHSINALTIKVYGGES